MNLVDPLGLECVAGSTVGTDGEDCSAVVVTGPRLRLPAPEPGGGAALLPSGRTGPTAPPGDGGGIVITGTRKQPQPPKFCSPTGIAISEGLYDVGTALTDKSSALIGAGLIAKSPQLVLGGEIGALLGTVLQGAGATGRLFSSGNVVRARNDTIGIALSLFQSQTRAGSLAPGYTGGKAVELRTKLTPGRVCR